MRDFKKLSLFITQAWLYAGLGFFSFSAEGGKMSNARVAGCGVSLCYEIESASLSTNDVYPLMVAPNAKISIFPNPSFASPSFKAQSYSARDVTVDYKGRYISAEALNGIAGKDLFIDLQAQKIHILGR